MRKLTIDQARRAALGAQGFGRPAPSGRVDRRHFRRLFGDIGLLQLDSVNVLERSHYLPVFSRLGSYSKPALDEFTTRSGEIFEYWGHEASLLPVGLYPYLRHRMAAFRPWRRVKALQEEHSEYVDAVFAEVAANGPLTVGDLADPGSRKGNWWGWGNGKTALEYLFATGRITGFRNGNFGRVYDLPDRVIAAEQLAAPGRQRDDAFRHLLALAARHHALGTAADLADYYRLHLPTARPIVHDMAERGELIEVAVAGWEGPVYADPDMTIPRSIDRSALLSPFDPVVWARDRVERLFNFHYRIEIYVPQPKRVYGYYVLPFMLDGELVGRVDLKANRQDRVLEARGTYIEPAHDPSRVGTAMLEDLEAMCSWLGLDEVVVMGRGNLQLR